MTGSRGSVAIVVPAYNRADLIGETMRSLSRQTGGLGDVAAIYLADDSSTDDTIAVDGAVGAQFLAAFKKLIDEPARMLL